MIEFSHEANASLAAMQENLKMLVDATVNQRTALVAVEKDPVAFLHRVGKATLAVSRSLELFVAAVSESARQTGVFPTVLPRRPQPANNGGATVTLGGGSAGNAMQRNASCIPMAMRRTRSIAPAAAATLQQQQAAPPPPEPSPPERKTAIKDTMLRAPSIVSATSVETTPMAPSATKPTFADKTRKDAPAPMAAASGKDGTATGTKHAARALPETVENVVATGAYMLLEVLVRQTMACDAVWYAYREGWEEAKAVALYGAKPRATTSVRQPIRNGVVGAVLRSGFAINIAPESPTETNPLALCVPIFSTTGRTHPIGVVMLQHKATNEPFTSDDEVVTASWTMLAARAMCDYGVDLTVHAFDPFRVLLQTTSPLKSYSELGLDVSSHRRGAKLKQLSFGMDAEAKLLDDMMNETARLLEVQASAVASQPAGEGGDTAKQANRLRTRAAGIASYSSRLAQNVASFPPPFKVFHSVHHNHFTAIRGAQLGGSGVTLQTQNLMDVAEYVASLEDCWKRTTEDLQGIELEHVAQMEDFRARKRRLKASQSRAMDLEEQMAHYKDKYESLKLELSAICGKPVESMVGDDGISAALTTLTAITDRPIGGAAEPASPTTQMSASARMKRTQSTMKSVQSFARLPAVAGASPRTAR